MLLLDMASRVRSLIIEQSDFEDDTHPHFFGCHKTDWASTLIEMISRKLKVLVIFNDQKEFLNRDNVEILKEVRS